jgi:hypothetical protein
MVEICVDLRPARSKHNDLLHRVRLDIAGRPSG